MGAPYHQFCPVAKAMELLDERWTLLVVRELVCGAERFSEVRRGLPRMSPTLLSRRLHTLAAAGVVERHQRGEDVRYVLTAAGRELEPVVRALSVWGTRWVGELGDADLDPGLLVWSMHLAVARAQLPPGRTVLRVRFEGPPAAGDWWMLLSAEDVDLCDADPGFDADVELRTDLRTLTRVWRGDVPWQRALRSGAVRLSGPGPLRRALPSWFELPAWAGVPRPVPDRGAPDRGVPDRGVAPRR
ncbi:winged helix-turn-helix transcriptional regulator [Kineococcus indalonis]|uniref:winged helix-turn-helix transcriptional regulator n=1 Tax=Kineococcus indalonis TaxID=2696566 RepID=UPI001411F755|nr:helix-turn-helix domain-containing protein [Kineococcus indalonis]NAZ86427.1 transcriptional regulator [Kineococcus indalonis]